jgi:hypothetical protein
MICHIYDVDPNFIYETKRIAIKACSQCGPELRNELLKTIAKEKPTCFKCGGPANIDYTLFTQRNLEDWVFACREHALIVDRNFKLLREGMES